MSVIRQLPQVLVNQIAAGEVIERPASVVKELIENSLDAGGTRVEVTLELGGTQLIRVHDDGKGMGPEDLSLALAPHATSKIAGAEDLAAIGTLGFRGEALASIGSVARVRITSRPADESDSGAMIRAEGGVETGPEPCGSPGGTTIEVRDLFFNTPARRKFLRTAGTEYGHCYEAFVRTAMAHPGVHWTLIHNGKTTLDLPAAEPVERCLAILGHDLVGGLLAFESEARPGGAGVRVWGLAGTPDLARPTSRQQYVFVNGRPVRDRSLSHAVREAYRGLLASDKQPVAVVMVEVAAEKVDVNVHPTKSEVRFHEPSAVHGAVLSAIRQVLLGTDLTAPASLARSFGGGVGRRDEGAAVLGWKDAGGATDAEQRQEPVRAFVEYFKQMAPSQQKLVLDEVTPLPTPPPPHSPPHAANSSNAESPESSWAGSSGGGVSGEAEGGALHDVRAYGRATPILQVHGSYVVTEDDQGLVIVDQHALHERVMYETLLERVLDQGKPLETQRMLMPVTVALEPSEIELLGSLEPLLTKVGLEIEAIGPRAVAVQAYPSLLVSRGVEAEGFVRSLMDLAAAGRLSGAAGESEEAALHEVLDLMSCKAAVKAGDRLSDEELSSLLAQRERVERSSRCPHGRPTTLRLTLRDLERQFGRT
ncbi:MAG: DNA mismatch repair endonuclease MutL [Phycisphaeraceae bacterium]